MVFSKFIPQLKEEEEEKEEGASRVHLDIFNPLETKAFREYLTKDLPLSINWLIVSTVQLHFCLSPYHRKPIVSSIETTLTRQLTGRNWKAQHHFFLLVLLIIDREGTFTMTESKTKLWGGRFTGLSPLPFSSLYQVTVCSISTWHFIFSPRHSSCKQKDVESSCEKSRMVWFLNVWKNKIKRRL